MEGVPVIPPNHYENIDSDNWSVGEGSSLSGNQVRDHIALQMWLEYTDYLSNP